MPNAFSLELNTSSRKFGVDQFEDETPKSNNQIRKLPDVHLPHYIAIVSSNGEFNNAFIHKTTNTTQTKDKNKQARDKNKQAEDESKQTKDESKQTIAPRQTSSVKNVAENISGDSAVAVNSAAAAAGSDNDTSNTTTHFCEVYNKKLYDIVKMYRIQIQKMDNISSANTDPQKYFCRAFSNLMLMEENTETPNKTYIANAKSDIKKAIAANKLVTEVFKIDIIEDRFLTAIFEKYNQITAKNMDDEQKALIADAIKQPQLLALKQHLDERYGEIDEYGETSRPETIDLTPYYTKNQLPLLNSITDPNGDVETQTQVLHNFRVTEDERTSAETGIDEILEVIQGLDVNEK